MSSLYTRELKGRGCEMWRCIRLCFVSELHSLLRWCASGEKDGADKSIEVLTDLSEDVRTAVLEGG